MGMSNRYAAQLSFGVVAFANPALHILAGRFLQGLPPESYNISNAI